MIRILAIQLIYVHYNKYILPLAHETIRFELVFTSSLNLAAAAEPRGRRIGDSLQIEISKFFVYLTVFMSPFIYLFMFILLCKYSCDTFLFSKSISGTGKPRKVRALQIYAGQATQQSKKLTPPYFQFIIYFKNKEGRGPRQVLCVKALSIQLLVI